MAYSSRLPKVTMPSNHCEKDSQWIESALLALTPAHQLKARIKYSEAYSEAHKKEPVNHKKENAARKEANTRLRLFRDACLESYVKDYESSMNSITEHKSQFSGF